MNYDEIIRQKTSDVLEESEEVRKHRIGKIRQLKEEFLAKKRLREEQADKDKEQEKQEDDQ